MVDHDYCSHINLTRYTLLVSSSFESLKTGVILTLGQGEFGQLGLGENVMSRKKPALVDLSGMKIKKMAAGGMHTVCLTENSEVSYALSTTRLDSQIPVTSSDSSPPDCELSWVIGI